MSDEQDYLLISTIRHYAVCPRQFALIHIEQAWEENYFTAEGRLLHERVDSGEAEQRGRLRYERGVRLVSERYQIQGQMDLLEIETLPHSPPRYFPVEYKRGKPKVQDWDRIQVCAQALCLEEMRDTQVSEGAIWYWQTRKRQQVRIDEALRTATLAAIEGARELLMQGKTPPPILDQSRCKACSLVDVCEPALFKKDRSTSYVSELFNADNEEP